MHAVVVCEIQAGRHVTSLKAFISLIAGMALSMRSPCLLLLSCNGWADFFSNPVLPFQT